MPSVICDICDFQNKIAYCIYFNETMGLKDLIIYDYLVRLCQTAFMWIFSSMFLQIKFINTGNVLSLKTQ